jgi:hypothetical protein
MQTKKNLASLHGAQNRFRSFEDFTKKFSESFFPINEPGTALHQLHSLKQNKDLSEYTAMFKQLCRKAGITNFAAQKDYYLRGLKPGILNKLCNSRDIPADFDGIVKKVITIENAYQILMSHRSRDNNHKKTHQ